MICRTSLIFCDNEHGTGDVCFPDVYGMSGYEVGQLFTEPKTGAELRKLAKAEGWGRINGGDYCPSCMDCMKENLADD